MATTTTRTMGRVWIIDAADETTERLAQLLSDHGHTSLVTADVRSLGEPGHPPPDAVG